MIVRVGTYMSPGVGGGLIVKVVVMAYPFLQAGIRNRKDAA